MLRFSFRLPLAALTAFTLANGALLLSVPLQSAAQTCKTFSNPPTGGVSGVSATAESYCSPVGQPSSVTGTLVYNGQVVDTKSASGPGGVFVNLSAPCKTGSYYSTATGTWGSFQSKTVNITC
jgi:hypothetical protein